MNNDGICSYKVLAVVKVVVTMARVVSAFFSMVLFYMVSFCFLLFSFWLVVIKD